MCWLVAESVAGGDDEKEMKSNSVFVGLFFLMLVDFLGVALLQVMKILSPFAFAKVRAIPARRSTERRHLCVSL